jgi:hypothetical protein
MSNAIDLEHLNETFSEHLCFDRPMGYHNGRILLDWLRHLRTPLPHCRGLVYGELQMILTPQQMAESVLKILDDVVADIYLPEEQEEAKARILDAWSAEMFQGRTANEHQRTC